MGFYKLIFVVSLVLALLLSGTDVCVAARQLLETPAFPTPDYVPKLTVLKPINIHHRKFPVFSSLPNLRTQPFLPGSHIPSQRELPHGGTQTVTPGMHVPSQPNLPETTSPKLLARPPPLPPRDHVPSQPTLPHTTSPVLPSGQIPSMPTEPALQESTLPNVPTDPKVKLPPPAAAQLPTIPATPTIPSKLPATPHLFPPPHA